MRHPAPEIACEPSPVGPPGCSRLVDQIEAAALAGCSKDTIARARRAGRLPHSRLHAGRWLLAVDDLASAGLLAAPAPPAPAPDVAPPPAAVIPVDLARAEARVAALEDLVARQDEELRFLRQLAADHLRKAC